MPEDSYTFSKEQFEDGKLKADSVKPKVASQYVGDVLPNQLDALNSPSYNLKLYMIGGYTPLDADATTQNTDDVSSEDIRQDKGIHLIQTGNGGGFMNDAVRAKPEQTVVLAQTGVTGVGIDNLELVTVPGGVSGSEQSTVTFTITQPNAADFPDQIVKARSYLGIPLDATDTPLFLEINFTGYSEAEGEGSQDGDGSGEPLTGAEQIGPYIFPLHLRSFTMDISTGGSSYDFICVVQDDLYSADAFFRLKKMFTTTGASIYDHLLDLQTQVNDHNEKNNAQERIDFGLNAETKTVPGLKLADQSLDITKAEKVANDKNIKASDAPDVRQAVGVVKEGGILKQIAGPPEPGSAGPGIIANQDLVKLDFKQGMKIDDIVGLLLSMNTEFMMKADRSKDPLNPSNEEVDNTKQLMWYRLKGTIKYSDWNEKKRQHQKIAYILPYTFLTDKTDIGVFPWTVKATNDITADDQRQRVNQMNIRKAYEYIFTGRNDQITNLNIQYKAGMSLIIPPDRGLLGDISLNAKSILNSNPVPKTETIRDGVEKLITSKKQGTNFFEQLSNLRKKGQEYMEKIGAAANFTGSQIKDLIDNANGKTAQELENLLSNQATAQAIADQLGPEGSATNQANVTTQSDSIDASGFVYGGDLTGNNRYSEQLRTNAKSDLFKDDGTKKIYLPPADSGQTEKSPVGLAQTYQELNKTGFTNITPTKDVKGNLFTYLYDQHQAQDFLVQLDMQIRGDPWWLGRAPQPAGIHKNPSGMATKNSLDVKQDSEYYITSDLDNFFLFSLNSPRFFDPNILDEDDNTGLWKQAGDGTSYFMSGIYRVKTATHTFNGGKYLIDVTSVKETAINLNELERLDQFSYIDENGTGLTARQQEGMMTEEEFNNRYGSHKYGAEFVRGFMRSSGKNAWQARNDGDITSAQYDAYRLWETSTQKGKTWKPSKGGVSGDLPFEA